MIIHGLTETPMEKIVKKARANYEAGTLEAKDKCCGKCAFSPNSLERCDPDGWEACAEQWSEGEIFVCHEGLPGHEQQVEGQELKVCAGWEAMKGKPFSEWIKLAYLDGREPDPKYNAGYPYFPSNEDFDGFVEKTCGDCLKKEGCIIPADAAMAFSGMKGLEPEEWIYNNSGAPSCTKKETI